MSLKTEESVSVKLPICWDFCLVQFRAFWKSECALDFWKIFALPSCSVGSRRRSALALASFKERFEKNPEFCV